MPHKRSLRHEKPDPSTPRKPGEWFPKLTLTERLGHVAQDMLYLNENLHAVLSDHPELDDDTWNRITAARDLAGQLGSMASAEYSKRTGGERVGPHPKDVERERAWKERIQRTVTVESDSVIVGTLREVRIGQTQARLILLGEGADYESHATTTPAVAEAASVHCGQTVRVTGTIINQPSGAFWYMHEVQSVEAA